MPTLRIKCIRDGLEDYEYLHLLAQATAKAKANKRTVPAGWIERAEKALTLSPDGLGSRTELVKSLTEYSTNGDDVLAARAAIARLLVEAPPTASR